MTAMIYDAMHGTKDHAPPKQAFGQLSIPSLSIACRSFTSGQCVLTS